MGRSVNRSLPDARMDDIDHALGRPKNPMRASYRNYYCVSAETQLAAHMAASPHWTEMMKALIADGEKLEALTTDRGG